MKSLRILIIGAMVSCAMICQAAEVGPDDGSKKIVNITYEQAIKIPGMMAAIYQQADPGFLNLNQRIHVVTVCFEKNIYKIIGTYEQWVRFFNMRWNVPITTTRECKIG